MGNLKKLEVITRWPRARQRQGPVRMLQNKQGGKPAGQDTSSYMAPQNVILALHFNNNYNYLDNSPKLIS